MTRKIGPYATPTDRCRDRPTITVAISITRIISTQMLAPVRRCLTTATR